MRINAPPPFELTFNNSPDDSYTIDYRPTDAWEGVIDVAIRGVSLRWYVAQVERDAKGRRALSGMTSGSEVIWQDQFWFELRPDDTPPIIRFWGNQIVWREDRT